MAKQTGWSFELVNSFDSALSAASAVNK